MGESSFGASALIGAIRANSIDRVIAALDDGANIEEADIHGYHGLPLRTACFSGNVPIIRTLLARGADINAVTADGPGAPVRLALRAGHTEVVALLLSKHAQIPFDLEIPPELFKRAQEISSEQSIRAEELEQGLEFVAIPVRKDSKPEIRQSPPIKHDNVIEYDAPAAPSQVFEQIELKGVYGVDTNVLNIDFERNKGAWEKAPVADGSVKPLLPDIDQKK
ncbi:ankyrin repeat domain-containing protein [Azonexus sp.]|uniref:ankyrin repeat domain-containing protein n=1 Tax=Azonexus sp. TaxID=1872668 RepID=UPI0027B9A721|nr:ankyrin repeat domain-containing protein [Azonexus sp.]